jgi:hypothetical protein
LPSNATVPVRRGSACYVYSVFYLLEGGEQTADGEGAGGCRVPREGEEADGGGQDLRTTDSQASGKACRKVNKSTEDAEIN